MSLTFEVIPFENKFVIHESWNSRSFSSEFIKLHVAKSCPNLAQDLSVSDSSQPALLPSHLRPVFSVFWWTLGSARAGYSLWRSSLVNRHFSSLQSCFALSRIVLWKAFSKNLTILDAFFCLTFFTESLVFLLEVFFSSLFSMIWEWPRFLWWKFSTLKNEQYSQILARVAPKMNNYSVERKIAFFTRPRRFCLDKL